MIKGRGPIQLSRRYGPTTKGMMSLILIHPPETTLAVFSQQSYMIT